MIFDWGWEVNISLIEKYSTLHATKRIKRIYVQFSEWNRNGGLSKVHKTNARVNSNADFSSFRWIQCNKN